MQGRNRPTVFHNSIGVGSREGKSRCRRCTKIEDKDRRFTPQG